MNKLSALSALVGTRLKKSVLELVELREKLEEEAKNNPSNLFEIENAIKQVDEALGKIRFDGPVGIDPL